MKQFVKLIECPRDAMQGWKKSISTDQKVEYINALLKVGFDAIDFGSFVSPTAIPQMADTREVVRRLKPDVGKTKLLAIVANIRGTDEAVSYDEISYLGFPFSISETFQQRNTHKSIAEAYVMVEEIQNRCVKCKKELVVYLSMGFGNPYGDVFSSEIVVEWANKLAALNVKTISLADTVGIATAEQVNAITKLLIKSLPNVEIGVHLHSTQKSWQQKLAAAVEAGCVRFDGAMKGIGGCPMADDVLIGNMDTELMIPYFQEKEMLTDIDAEALKKCSDIAAKIFV